MSLQDQLAQWVKARHWRAPWKAGSAVAVIVGMLLAFVAAPDKGEGCEDHPLRRVYAPSRLTVIQRCARVDVTVRTARREQDGDWHVNADVSTADQPTWVNAANRRRQDGRLVVEFVPGDPVPKNGFRAGMRLRLLGTRVLDVQHAGWIEQHPIFKTEILDPGDGRAPAAARIPGEAERDDVRQDP